MIGEEYAPERPLGEPDPAAEGGIGARTQARALQLAGGLRGGAGVPQAPGEAPLYGLPRHYKVQGREEKSLAAPSERIRKVARDYMRQAGLAYRPPTDYAKVDPERANRIGDAYAAMKHDPDHPLVKASYDQMIKETFAQYLAAKKAGFKAEFYPKDRDPYPNSPREAVEDVNNNHHMYVYPTESGFGSSDADISSNPLLADSGERWGGKKVTYNDIFRAVHDYFGHAKEGVGFRADGEENAWRSHAAMYSPLARMAMTSETRGQNSWLNYGSHRDAEKNRTASTADTVFADQKSGVMPHWAHHEGAEDFMTPEDIHAMQQVRGHYRRGGMVHKAMKLVKGR